MPLDPATLRIALYPAPVLRAKAKPIEKITDEVRAVAQRMLQIMREEKGIGLAAPQVGLSWRLFVCDVPPSDDPPDPSPNSVLSPQSSSLPSSTPGPQFYINPKLSDPRAGLEPLEEGCLSLPDIRGDVLRPPVITISALNLQGKPFTQSAAGLLARCWQHEIDHLDGILIIDKMSQMSRLKNRAAIKDLDR